MVIPVENGEYGIDVVKDNIYICPLNVSVYHPSYRDSDFVGNKKECLDFLEKHKDKKIYGLQYLKENK